MGGSGLLVILAVVVATVIIALGACALLGVAIFVIVKNNKAKSALDDTDTSDTDSCTDTEDECTAEEEGTNEAENQAAADSTKSE